MKGTAKIAYWDTEQQGARPPLLGEIKGTPTIRLYKPKKKQRPGSSKEKVVVDYNYERKAKDMKRFVDEHIPNAAEKIVNGEKDLDAFNDKAAKYGLPRALLFTSKSETMPLTKYLSTEFRRKLLYAEVMPTKKNKDIMDKYGITELPALLIFPVTPVEEDVESAADSPVSNGEPIRYEGDGFTKNKLHSFLSKYALKKIILPAEKKKEEPPPKPSSKVKEEL